MTRNRDRRAVLPKEVAIPEGFTTPVQANRTTLSVTRMAQYGEVCKAQSLLATLGYRLAGRVHLVAD